MKKLVIFLIGFLFMLINLCACGSSSTGGVHSSDPVTFNTVLLPLAQSGKEYEAIIEVSGGSGEYIINTDETLPDGLSITSDGVISGMVNLAPASYSFNVFVKDKNFQSNKNKKEFIINVLSLLPDEYEPNNDFLTGPGSEGLKMNVMAPNGENQEHTIHEEGDIDSFLIDFSSVKKTELVIFKGIFIGTDLKLQLYNSNRELLATAVNKENQNETILKYICDADNPDNYFIKVSCENICEYNIEVINATSPLCLLPESLPYAESITPYNQIIKTNDNIGKQKIFTIQSGQLPNGLNINNETGLISGINFQNGTFVFNVKVAEKEIPDNFDIKEYSITAYIGKKVIAEDVEKYLTWVNRAPDAPLMGSGTFKTTVQGSHALVFEEYEIPSVLSTWKDSQYYTLNGWLNKYVFNPMNGDVSMVFFSRIGNTQNDYSLIKEIPSGLWLTHTLAYRVYDSLYPDNYDIYYFKVNMQIRSIDYE